MTPLTSTQKKHLRGLAHPLKPLIQIGKGGLSSAVEEQLEQAFNDHELVKIKFNEYKEEKTELATTLATARGGQVVGIVGHVAILFRSHPKPEKRRIVVPA
ncbi:MAG: ribosome assembly RNA-binding protein YhbY [Magnetococcales bacterium]|nr:ribosome assembly RNA-binding protein YhbY [Magnetococcales bacterium]NGZ28073.1 ribosome assembly RNA-binding protein YhbY [Magnetococcales bacterium]